MTNLKWNRSHGDSMELETIEIPRRADPPASGGVGKFGADATAVDRGFDGFTNPSLWEVLTDSSDSYASGQIVQYVARLEESAAFRRGEAASLLSTLKNRLDRIPDGAGGSDLVSVQLGDLVLMTYLLLRRQA
jgi:hypothetical protein